MATVKFEGKEYTVSGEAYPTCRLFDGNGLNTKDGESYTVEYADSGQDSDGNPVEVRWQFREIKGQETEDESNYPWDDDHITAVISQ